MQKVLIGLLVVVVIGGAVWFLSSSSGPGPEQVVEEFFALVKAGDFQTAWDDYLSDAGKVGSSLEEFKTVFGVFGLLGDLIVGDAVINGDVATVNISVAGSGLETFPLPLVKEGGKWKVGKGA
ncbi:MAG: DUF4878 domain-containing protein [bacterium]|nr:DUF4878 domain-containing protein [bacterium]